MACGRRPAVRCGTSCRWSRSGWLCRRADGAAAGRSRPRPKRRSAKSHVGWRSAVDHRCGPDGRSGARSARPKEACPRAVAATRIQRGGTSAPGPGNGAGRASADPSIRSTTGQRRRLRGALRPQHRSGVDATHGTRRKRVPADRRPGQHPTRATHSYQAAAIAGAATDRHRSVGPGPVGAVREADPGRAPATGSSVSSGGR
jgi:hypothetical protein